MDRKVLILPCNRDEIFERTLGENSNGQLERHAVGYLEFIKQNALEYPGYENDAGYHLAIYLSSCGYVVLQRDSSSVFYFPDSFTENQYFWLKKHKREIRRWNFSIVDIDDGCIHLYDNITLGGIPVYQKFREILDNKNVVTDKKIEKGERVYVSNIRN